MGKYRQIFLTSLSEGFTYRLNFIMWRLRTVLQFFALYLMWWLIYQSTDQLFDYSRSAIFTYILASSILRSFVFSSRSVTVGVEIATGDLNNYLTKPVSYFSHWLSRDLADKALNIFFLIIEVTAIIILLKPPLISLPSAATIALTIAAAILALLMYFIFSFLVSTFAFWYPEHNGWPMRFLIFMILEFVAGGVFPLDILPTAIYQIVRYLPPAYMLFFPSQIFLGRLSTQAIFLGLAQSMAWIVALYLLLKFVWSRGLKTYGAYGR